MNPLDRMFNKTVSAADSAISKVPRGVFEIMLVLGFALAVVWVFNKNIYFGVGAVVSLFAGLVLLVRPIMLIYAVMVFVPVVWVNLLGRRFRVITFLSLICFVYYVSQAILRKVKAANEPMFIGYTLYILACALSLINSMDISFSIASSKYFILSVMFGFAAYLAIEDKKQLKTLLWIFLIAGIFESVLSFLQSVVSDTFYPSSHFRIFGSSIVDAYSIHGVRRASGTFQSGPRYAMFILGPMAVALAAIWRNLEGKRMFWIGLLGIYILGLFVSFTRAALVLAIGYVFFYNIIERNWDMFTKSIIWFLIIAIMAVALIGLVVPDEVSNALWVRMEEDDEDYLDRFYLLYNAIRAWMENPILGLGVGTYPKHSWDLMQKYPVPWESLTLDIAPLAMPHGASVHNDYGRMLAETGIFSLIGFFLMCFFAMRNFLYVLRNSKDQLYQTVAVGFAMYLGALMLYWYFHEYVMEEPYTCLMPFLMAVLLKKLVRKELEAGSDQATNPT